jgi:hypothetical protein
LIKDFVKESYDKERGYFEEVITTTPQIWNFVENTLLKDYSSQDDPLQKDSLKFNTRMAGEITNLVSNLKSLHESIRDINLIERRKSDIETKKLQEELTFYRKFASEKNPGRFSHPANDPNQTNLLDTNSMTFNTHNTNGATLQNTNTNFLSDLNCTNP